MAARSPAAGAWRSTASASSAASAWWARRAGSGRAPRSASAASALRCSARRRWGESASSTATRAISWRKRTASRSARSMPDARHASRPSRSPSASAASSDSSARSGDDRHGVQQRPRAVVEPRGAGEHGVADASRGSRRRPPRAPRSRRTGCRRSGDTARRGRPRSDPASSATPWADSGASAMPRGRAAGQLAQRPSAAGGAVDLVVAVGGHDERRERLDAAGEQAQRRRASPRRPSAGPRGRRCRAAGRAASPEGREQRARGPALGHHRGGLAAQLVGDVDERPERARGEERVARAPQDPARARASQKARTSAVLPIPASPRDEHQPPAPCAAHRRQVLVERVELGGALEELHRPGRRAVGHGTCSPVRALRCERSRSARRRGVIRTASHIPPGCILRAIATYTPLGYLEHRDGRTRR